MVAEPDERGVPRLSIAHGRRVSDKVLLAFHHACDIRDADIAGDLLRIVAMILGRPEIPRNRRVQDREDLVAAYARLWLLRHPIPDNLDATFDVVPAASNPSAPRGNA
jgi:hypothetical protein